jgi:uncharacterized protein YneF (UPF0154 family)
MITLLKNLYIKAEDLKGKKLLLILVLTFVIFLIIGIAVGYFMPSLLNKNEIKLNLPIAGEQPKYYQGKVTYVNPSFYPGEKISFSLVDSQGKDIILLRSEDQKLSIAENLVVKVTGIIHKTKDGKSEVLDVTELIIKNAAD